MKLTQKNYYTAKANQSFMSVSQFKDFLKCPAMAMAKLSGEYEQEKSRALILGSYVDEMLTGSAKSRDAFIVENYDELFKRGGSPYADVAQAQETIERVKKQPLMMRYLSGKHQKIMTGEIEGVPFKIKMDSFDQNEYIADLKYMASLRSPNLFTPMVEYWGYDIQAACYQEIVYQNTGKRLPFFFVVATKEKPAHLAVGQISQWNIDKAMEIVRANIVNFQKIKTGEIEPDRCDDYGCDYCTSTKVITEAIDTDLFGMSAAQIRGMRGDL